MGRLYSSHFFLLCEHAIQCKTACSGSKDTPNPWCVSVCLWEEWRGFKSTCNQLWEVAKEPSHYPGIWSQVCSKKQFLSGVIPFLWSIGPFSGPWGNFGIPCYFHPPIEGWIIVFLSYHFSHSTKSRCLFVSCLTLPRPPISLPVHHIVYLFPYP